ncbi:MAG: DUF853 family protein [Proteobacteria bacterium]|nr:MAG: DUF853 family protein [Pseudomonadota bacterium]
MNSVGTMFDRIFGRERESEVILGRVHNSIFRKAKLSERELNHHVHIVGASGFGKTVLLSHLIEQRIGQGKGLLFLDLKGDLDTIEKFRGYAAKSSREADVQILSLGHASISSPYNLLGTGTPTQIRDRIMIALNWSEEFYKNQASSFLLKLLIGLCWLRDHAGEQLDIFNLLEVLSNREVIENACMRIPETNLEIRRCVEEVVTSTRSPDYWNSLQGLRTQIESLVLSDFGALIKSAPGGIDLFDSVTKSKIILIFLDTRSYGETAKTIGRFVLQDLKAVSAKVDAEVPKKDRKAFSVIIDEFADLAQEDFIAFLDRARSSRMSVVVAHQELSDLQRISPEFAGRLMGNTATVFAFLQKGGDSSETLASLAGTKTVLKKTERHSRRFLFDIGTGETSVREAEEFIIHPNVIKSLGVGQCVCIKKYPHARAIRIAVYREK